VPVEINCNQPMTCHKSFTMSLKLLNQLTASELGAKLL